MVAEDLSSLEPLSCLAGGSVYRARPLSGVLSIHRTLVDLLTGGLNPVVSRGYYSDQPLYGGLSVRFLFVEELTLPVSPEGAFVGLACPHLFLGSCLSLCK